nr:MAG TPA: hypothetical protein [Bacteriophage sp.]
MQRERSDRQLTYGHPLIERKRAYEPCLERLQQMTLQETYLIIIGARNTRNICILCYLAIEFLTF